MDIIWILTKIPIIREIVMYFMKIWIKYYEMREQKAKFKREEIKLREEKREESIRQESEKTYVIMIEYMKYTSSRKDLVSDYVPVDISLMQRICPNYSLEGLQVCFDRLVKEGILFRVEVLGFVFSRFRNYDFSFIQKD